MPWDIEQLMTRSGVKFGTSGARGLVADLTDAVCFAYTKAFLQYLQASGSWVGPGLEVAVAGDLRPSTNRILEAVCRGIEDGGHRAVNCGLTPSPAVALFGLAKRIPAIMVTGSHIPDDRNGIKFNKPTGEILKSDEEGITRQAVAIDEAFFDSSGMFRRSSPTPRPVESAATAAYIARYLDFFPAGALGELRVGVYQHSAVGRDVLLQVIRDLGAEVIPLGRSDRFVPVDTEAIRPEDVRCAREWAAEHRLDAIVSADGDSDRPLLSDEHGCWLRGDLAGILCARYLGADSISTPVSCNTAVEQCGWFQDVRRTRIGSPYVIGGMQAAAEHGWRRVVGYEANGGFLIQSDLEREGKILRSLPTRDALIVLLSVLHLSRLEGRTVAQLAAALPARHTASDRLQNIPTDRSQAVLDGFTLGDQAADRRAIDAVFGGLLGKASSVDRTDGLRITFETGEIVHLRPSGNAPEFRCYNEAASAERAHEINRITLEIVRELVWT